MIEWSIWALWWLIVGSAIVWVIVGSAGYWVRLGWVPEAAAAWAQALGTLLAIVVAISVPAFQAHQRLLEKNYEQKEAKQAGSAAVRALLNYHIDLYGRLSKAQVRPVAIMSAKDGVLPHELRQSAAMLREVAVNEFSNDLVHIVLGLRQISANGEFAAARLETRASLFSVELIDAQKKAREDVALMNTWIDLIDNYDAAIRDV